MNIMYLINSFNYGGAEKLCYDLAKEINSTNYKVYICSMADIISNLEKNTVQYLSQQNIEVTTLKKRPQRDRFRCVWRLRKYLIDKQIDVIHTNGQSPDLYGRLACILLNRVKVIVSIHNTKDYCKFIERMLSRMTTQYIVVSIQVKKYCIYTLGINETKIKLIPNSIEVNRYQSATGDDIRAKLGISSDDFLVITVGRFNKQKNYDGMFRAMKKLMDEYNDIQWLIVGNKECDSEYFVMTTQLMSPDMLSTRVHFTGAVQDDERYLKSADCFLLASEYEGFGIAFIEAMAAEIPMAATNVGIIPDLIIGNACIHLIEDNNIKNSVEYIYRNIITEKENTKINLNIVRNNYDIHNISKLYCELYEKP